MNVVVNNVSYHVETYGQGEPLLLLHGFTGDVSTWYPVVPIFTDRYQLILIDILGHGKTESPLDVKRYEINNVANDIKGILNQLHIQELNILGYSMGGRLALAFTMLFPDMVKSLILESASPGLKDGKERATRQEQDERLANMILAEGIDAFVEYWTNISLFKTQQSLPMDIQQEIKKQRLNNNPIGLANSLKGMGTGVQPSWWDSLGDLHNSVLLMTGSLDEKFSLIANKMKNTIQNVRNENFLNTGHAIHVEDSQKFGTIVREFLSK